MDSFQAHTSTGTWLAQPDQTQKSTPLSPSKLPASLKPSTVPIYAQQHKGLWQPTTPSIFVVIMSTFHNTNRSLPNETVTPLAHCPTLDSAREALQALARQHCGAGVTEDIDLGHYVKVSGTGKRWTSTRSMEGWVVSGLEISVPEYASKVPVSQALSLWYE